MTNQEQAAELFRAREREIIELDYRGVGVIDEINARYGFSHGWIVVNGESFNKEKAFPMLLFPRFPADQGTSD